MLIETESVPFDHNKAISYKIPNMSDYYNLRPRSSVTATEGFNVEQAPEGPGPMAAELAGPAPTQVEEG